MQPSETIRLFQAFECMFPQSYIQIAGSGNRILHETAHKENYPVPPFPHTRFQEIRTIEGDNGTVFFGLFLPLPPSGQIRILIPSSQVKDGLTAAKMADSAISLFLSRPARLKQLSCQSRLVLLLDHLVHPASVEDHTYTALLAAELGIDTTLPRAACLFRLEYDSSASSATQISYSILQTMRSFISSSSSQDILGSFDGKEIILLHVMEKDREDTNRFIESIYTYINKNHPVLCSVGIGLTVDSIGDYPESLASARSAFRYACNHAKTELPIFYVTDFLVEHLVYEIPEALFEHLFEQELAYIRSNETAAETIKALVEHNMDLVSAANSLFIHRNTMIFRLNQLKKQLKLNPLHRDCHRFKLILLYHYISKK